MGNIKTNYEQALFLFIFLIIPTLSLAQPNFVGKWKSEEMKEGTEKVIIEFIFKDTTNMEMAFITDNAIPDVGRCVSRISVQGTYSVIGPLMFTEILKNTMIVDIKDFELIGEKAKKTPQSMIPTLKTYIKKQLEQSAMYLFAAYDGGSMIYATHEGTKDVISFIIGDEENAIDLKFTRQKSL